MSARIATAATLALGLAALLIPAPAVADVEGLYDEYLRAGSIDGCAQSRADVLEALQEMPTDIAAYDPGFTDALNRALEQQASGCRSLSSEQLEFFAGAGTVTSADGSPGPSPPSSALSGAPAGPPEAASKTPVLLLLGLTAAALLLALAAILTPGRRRG